MQLGCQFSHLMGESFYFVLLEQNSIGVSKQMLAPRHFLARWARYWKVKEIPRGTASLANYSWRCFSQPFQAVPVLLDCHSLLTALFHLHLVPTVLLIATAMAKKHRFPLLTCLQPCWDLPRGLFPGTVASTVFWIMFSWSKLFDENPGGMWYYLHLKCLRADRWKYKSNTMMELRKRTAPKEEEDILSALVHFCSAMWYGLE